jgi:hypothetical protein
MHAVRTEKRSVRMLFSARAAAKYTGVAHHTLSNWSRAGIIPFGVRPLVDGHPTYHRWDLDYVRETVIPSRGGAGVPRAERFLTRAPAGIVYGIRR